MTHYGMSHEFLWIYPPIDLEWQAAIIKEFGIHPVIAQLLVSRQFKSFDEIHHYLYAKLPDLLDPHLFHDMDKAVTRILEALQDRQNILIYGDNDVDGMTGSALLVEFLRYLGANVYFYIPSKTSLKQSIILDALEFASKNQCRLLITVDCGITAANEIQEAVAQNVDVIVTDHHEPTAKLPHCVATLNPKLLNSTYPNRALTGVGVAFKLIHALTNVLISNEEIAASKIDLKRYLDLVALGTIADMGSLLGENRILVRYGLKQLKKTKRIGLITLFAICDVKAGEISTSDITSKIAPRLNSPGRIADATKVVELLLTRDPSVAENLAKELDLNNTERQKIERRDSEDVDKYIQKNPSLLKNRALVLSSEKWHPGVIPIISARIAKQYNRPAVLISLDRGMGKGSMRTIPEFPLLPHLKELEDLLLNFGGHDFAAGLTIKEKNIENFKERFIARANQCLKDQDITAKLKLDAHIRFQDLTFDLLESLQLLEPFGNENPPPILFSDVIQLWLPKVIGKMHLKLYLAEEERTLEGVAFGMADRKESLLKKNLPLRVAFTPQINTFLNKASIQLQIRDFQIVENKRS